MKDTVTLQAAGRFASSSSQRVEELTGASGLPARASIAGCLLSNRMPEEWGALLQRVGQERSRVEELGARLPVGHEDVLFEECVKAVFQRVWIGEVGGGHREMGCVFLAGHSAAPAVFGSCGRIYAVQVARVEPARRKPDIGESRTREAMERIVPDTDKAYTVQQMARAWELLGKPITEDDTSLSVDPDDYPLF